MSNHVFQMSVMQVAEQGEWHMGGRCRKEVQFKNSMPSDYLDLYIAKYPTQKRPMPTLRIYMRSYLTCRRTRLLGL